MLDRPTEVIGSTDLRHWWARLRDIAGPDAGQAELVDAHCRNVFKATGWDLMTGDEKGFWRTAFDTPVADALERGWL